MNIPIQKWVSVGYIYPELGKCKLYSTPEVGNCGIFNPNLISIAYNSKSTDSSLVNASGRGKVTW